MATITNQRLVNLRSLVIDDMPTMRQSIRTQLGEIGIPQVDQAGSPDEAIERVRKQSYDIIVCDYNMNKDTNGQQLLEYLRSQNLLSPSAIFIMVTAENNYTLVASAAEFQPDAYMVKPLTGGKLLERLDRLLDKQNALKAVSSKINRKDYAGAVAECDVVMQSEPKWAAEVIKIKASSLLELGKPDEALAVYQKALSLRDDLVWAKLGVARCYLMSGDLNEAKLAAKDVLTLSSQYIPAYDLLAKISEALGEDEEALNSLNRSYDVIPSARRSRMVGDAAYRSGNTELARTAFERAVNHTKGSVTAYPSDVISLAQIHIDLGNANLALETLSAAPKNFTDANSYAATQAALQAQAHIKLGNAEEAEKSFDRAKKLATTTRADVASLTLAKAAFSLGRDDEGSAILSKAVSADHENSRTVLLARKVLKDTGKDALMSTVVDDACNKIISIVNEANALMRQGQFDESLAKLDEALKRLPENTGVLLAAAQLHLLWMSQKGLNRDYVAKVNGYLSKLDVLMPGSERVSKMYRFLRDTLNSVTKKD